jgi:hypothetical protein
MRETSALMRLAREQLSSEPVRFAPDLDREIVRSIAPSVNAGLRLVQGERHLAVFAEPDSTAPPYFAGFALTSAKLVAAGRSIALDAVLGARVGGSNAVEIATARGPVAVQTAAAPALGAFLTALAEVRPSERFEARRPLLAADAIDPVGLVATMNGLVAGVDDGCVELLALVPSVWRAGAPLPTAQDLAARAVLLHRTRNEGRGMDRRGAWLSPLSLPDLQLVLSRIVGLPSRTWQAGAATVGAVATTGHAMGAAAAAMGARAFEALRGAPAVRLELGLAPATSATSFTLRVHDGPVPPALVRAQLFEALLTAEARWLALRAVCGWQMPPDRLAAMPTAAFAEAVAAIAPHADVARLLPGPEPAKRAPPAAEADTERG